jgi:hypothetical protein
MATQVQQRRGTTAEHATFTGAVGEVTVDTDKDTAVVHDGTTAGGRPLMRQDMSNVPAGTVTSTMIADGTIVNADINASAAIAGSKVAPSFVSDVEVLASDNATTRTVVLGPSDYATSGKYLAVQWSHALQAGVYYTQGAFPHTFFTNNTERARIDSSGRLLVGTSSTSGNATLHVNKASSGGTDAGGLLLSNLAAMSSIGAGDDIGYINFGASTTGGVASYDAARILCEADATWGSGDYPTRLTFSTTADGASSPTERMRIRKTGDVSFYTAHTNVHIARSGNDAGTTDSIYVGVCNATNTANGTVVYRVYTNGTYATISDANQKKNIETTRDGYLEDLNKLRVVKYNWNEQAESEPKELGLIAQEVEEVFPGLVTKISESSEESEFKGIKTGVLPYMLLKALQEATTRIETLEAEVAALKVQ